MKYTHCFFDLDGTLIDSSEGITHSAQYALEQLGRTPPPAKDLLCFIGPPIGYCFSHFFGMSEADAAAAVKHYREIYRVRGIFQVRIYDGIKALLKALTEAGIICAVATCKPRVFAEQIIKNIGLEPYISFVSGPEMDGTRNEKHEVIAYAMERLGIDDPEKILMIGDRLHDAEGAAHHGIDCAGVLWGFGSAEELLGAGAAALYNTPEELGAALLSGSATLF